MRILQRRDLPPSIPAGYATQPEVANDEELLETEFGPTVDWVWVDVLAPCPDACALATLSALPLSFDAREPEIYSTIASCPEMLGASASLFAAALTSASPFPVL